MEKTEFNAEKRDSQIIREIKFLNEAIENLNGKIIIDLRQLLKPEAMVEKIKIEIVMN